MPLKKPRFLCRPERRCFTAPQSCLTHLCSDELALKGQRVDEMGEAFTTACTRIEARPTGPLVADRGANSCLPSPSWFLSAAPKGRSCGGKKRRLLS